MKTALVGLVLLFLCQPLWVNAQAPWLPAAILPPASGVPAPTCKPRGIRYNEVRQISSHNSYDECGSNPLYCAHKPDLPQQADLGVRSFEIDIHQGGLGWGDSPHSDWDVYHIGGGSGDHCGHLSQCLAKLRIWHDGHPNHDVITVWIELKSQWEVGGHHPVDLDNNRLEQDLRGLLYTPGDLLRNCPGAATLQDAVTNCGWPTLESLRGKFIIVLMGDDQRQLANYLDDVNQYRGGYGVGNNGYHGNKICFVAPDISTYEAREIDQEYRATSGRTVSWHNAVFFNIHNAASEVWASGNNLWAPARIVFQRHLVSRAWRIDNQNEWAQARINLAHHLATEHVAQELFTPRAVDVCGLPMEPMVSTGRGS